MEVIHNDDVKLSYTTVMEVIHNDVKLSSTTVMEVIHNDDVKLSSTNGDGSYP